MKTLITLILLVPLLVNATENKRSKSINFEDELIEGINRKPLDQLNQISERNGYANGHLYRKRKTFQDRNRTLFKEWNRGGKP
jgi:hypothetical protein